MKLVICGLCQNHAVLKIELTSFPPAEEKVIHPLFLRKLVCGKLNATKEIC